MNIDTIDKRKNIINDLWTWYPCGVACGAGEMIEETSTLTGSSWTTSGQYLRAGGGCSSMLIRQKSSTDDEYHHIDMVGMFDIITNQTVSIISNSVFDAFGVERYTTTGTPSKALIIAQPVKLASPYNGSCLTGMSEPGMQSSPGGGAVSFQARALNTTSKKSKKAKPCHSSGVSRASQCQTGYHHCKDLANSAYHGCIGALTGVGIFFGGWIGGTIGGAGGADAGGLVGAGVGTVEEPGGGTVLGGLWGSVVGGLTGAFNGTKTGATWGGLLGGALGTAGCSLIHNKTLSKCYTNYWGCINNPGTPVTKWFPA